MQGGPLPVISRFIAPLIRVIYGYITPVTHLFSAIHRGGPYVTPFTTTGFWAQVWHLRHLSAQPAAGDDARCGWVAGAIFALGSVVTPLLRRERL